MASVLVVDRNPVVRMVIQRTLAGEGFVVREATSCHTDVLPLGLAPDVVLVEVETPEAHHLDPLRRLRARYPDVPVIACANRAGPSSADDAALRSGAFALLRKPVQLEALVETVHGALGLDPFARPPLSIEPRSVLGAAPPA
ncbi:MAG: response regulator [Deltaproteobacteria bacterium]|jgi:CheY-like chemotaxis protein|nr:response regulator [Deltaproteobacteria bacterium]